MCIRDREYLINHVMESQSADQVKRLVVLENEGQDVYKRQVKSNAKALLTGTPIKNATCKQVLRSPKALRGVSVCRWHTRLRTDRASRRDQRAAFEKALSAHSPKLYPVSKCDDGDNVFHSVLLSKTFEVL